MEVSSGNTNTEGKFRERRVFLFEQIVIISESEKRKNEHSNPSYVFKNSLKVSTANIRLPLPRDLFTKTSAKFLKSFLKYLLISTPLTYITLTVHMHPSLRPYFFAIYL